MGSETAAGDDDDETVDASVTGRLDEGNTERLRSSASSGKQNAKTRVDLSGGSDAKTLTGEASAARKYEEYFLRHRLPDRLAASTFAVSSSANANDATFELGGSSVERPTVHGNPYVAEIRAGEGSADDSESGLVPANAFGVATAKMSDTKESETALDAFDRLDRETRLAVKAQDPTAFPDRSTADMMAQLKREARAYVNPATGNAMRWGDTWRHEWGGGVGVSSYSEEMGSKRRMLSDGTTMIVSDPTKKEGFALVPTSVDKRALEEFYEECNGPRWSVRKNWGVGEPCAHGWHGVVCVGGRVTELWMNLNNVACWGKFNLTALARLDELRYLDLSDNLFGGRIPEELFEMKKLQSLVLSSNRLEGELSPRFGELKHLRHLDISANGLSGPLPAEMGALAELEVLYLGESGLEVRNNLEGKIPESWKGMTSLTRLSLGGNNLIKGTFPAWIGSLPGLEELTLSGVSLRGEIPKNIHRLMRLRVLDVSGNGLTGTIPESLSRLRELKHLRLGGNAFKGVLPESLFGLPRLETLDVSGNALHGTFHESFRGLTRLEYLDLSRNAFAGPFPSAIRKLSNLRTVLLHGNAFTGTLPGWVFDALPRLMHLYLDGNALTGTLPGASIGAAAFLKELHLGENAFSGEIPPSLGGAPRLASLRLHGNKFTGRIPPELGNLKALVRLDLSSNALTGPLPRALADATELAELRLSHNALSGEVPRALRTLPLLRELHLNDNAFTGSVPNWLAAHPCLRVADLSRNKLSGALPESLYDASLDDGEGGFGGIPKLPARHDRYAGEEERRIVVSKNPLECPLPDWADEVEATCVDAEVHSVEPSFGDAAGGTEVVIRGAHFPTSTPPDPEEAFSSGSPLEDFEQKNRTVGCVFSFGDGPTSTLWTEALRGDETSVTCVTPPRVRGSPTNAAVVRIGVDGEPITRFGELFHYARRESDEVV